MKKELEHFYIGNSYGGNQDWFRTFMMRLGGCGAETACDSSIYFAMHKGIKGIYPFDISNLSKFDYIEFAHIMEKYLWPRMSGIDKPEIYMEGYGKYLRDRGISGLSMDVLSGDEPYDKAVETVRAQIDAGYPVPTLILNHRDREYRDYVWHWFLINGYRVDALKESLNDPLDDQLTDPLNSSDIAKDKPDADSTADSNGTISKSTMQVKTVTYSGYRWLDFERLWDTGYSNKGGLILYNLEQSDPV